MCVCVVCVCVCVCVCVHVHINLWKEKGLGRVWWVSIHQGVYKSPWNSHMHQSRMKYLVVAKDGYCTVRSVVGEQLLGNRFFCCRKQTHPWYENNFLITKTTSLLLTFNWILCSLASYPGEEPGYEASVAMFYLRNEPVWNNACTGMGTRVEWEWDTLTFCELFKLFL